MTALPPPEDGTYRQHMLLAGLIGEHRALFENNVRFHSQLISLSEMLAEWADALAAKAQGQQSDIEHRIATAASFAPRMTADDFFN